jgi:CheY-like chemotaxis protein
VTSAGGVGSPDDVVVLGGSGAAAGGAGGAPSGRFQRVDVILLDIMMRRSNGVDVAVELRRVFRDAAVDADGASAAAASAMLVAQSTSTAMTPTVAQAPRTDRASFSSASSGERYRLPPIVAMTGNTSLQNIETYKRAGFWHVLPKPFDVSGVQSTLVACTVADRSVTGGHAALPPL